MNLKILNKNEIHIYSNFIKNIYKDNEFYHDSLCTVIKSIHDGNAEISNSSWIQPVIVYNGNTPVLSATLAIVDRMDDTLQISYFEMKDKNEKAFELFMSHVKKTAVEKNTTKISAGLNLHVNYGLGFLASHFDSPQSFGSSYNAPFYCQLFEMHGFDCIDMVSYLTDMDAFEFPVEKRLMDRIKRRYTVRKADFKNIEKEANIYTTINNDAFKNHMFYYERRKREDLELFNDFKHLLREENLLFVECGGEPVGFMLWYPDYNQLLSKGESVGVMTVIKNLLFKRRIDKFKIVEIGINEKHQKTGAILALFEQCYALTKGRYRYCEGGWILDRNLDSKNFGVKWADNEYKRYKSFIMDVKEE